MDPVTPAAAGPAQADADLDDALGRLSRAFARTERAPSLPVVAQATAAALAAADPLAKRRLILALLVYLGHERHPDVAVSAADQSSLEEAFHAHFQRAGGAFEEFEWVPSRA